MTTNRRLIEWLDALIAKRETNAAAVAELAGINKSTITKWRGGQRPNPADLRSVARALNAPVLEAFLAAGFIAAGDTRRVVEVDRPLSGRTDDELIAEVRRRMTGERNELEIAPEPDASPEGDEAQEAGPPDSPDDPEAGSVAGFRSAREAFEAQVDIGDDSPQQRT